MLSGPGEPPREGGDTVGEGCGNPPRLDINSGKEASVLLQIGRPSCMSQESVVGMCI